MTGKWRSAKIFDKVCNIKRTIEYIFKTNKFLTSWVNDIFFIILKPDFNNFIFSDPTLTRNALKTK